LADWYQFQLPVCMVNKEADQLDRVNNNRVLTDLHEAVMEM
jgi:hypothetical protein